MMPKSKHASQPQAKPLKYEPVPVTPTPCSLEELEIHLRGFIRNFIAEEAQERWLDYLIAKRPLWFALEMPPKNIKVLHKAYGLLNNISFQEDYVTPIEGADTFPLSLAPVYGGALGVYFDLHTAPCKMTAAQAATKATEGYADAIFSLVAGRSALAFHHEGGLWRCKK